MFDVHPSQKKAVEHHQGPLLIIAGPGSGKTYTLVERIMNLIHVHSEPPRDCRRLNILREYDNENTKLHS